MENEQKLSGQEGNILCKKVTEGIYAAVRRSSYFIPSHHQELSPTSSRRDHTSFLLQLLLWILILSIPPSSSGKQPTEHTYVIKFVIWPSFFMDKRRSSKSGSCLQHAHQKGVEPKCELSEAGIPFQNLLQIFLQSSLSIYQRNCSSHPPPPASL